MKKKQIIGILLIIISLIVSATLIWNSTNKEEKTEKKESKMIAAKEQSEPTEEQLATQQESGAENDENLITQVQVEIKGMKAEVKADIADVVQFEYQVKKYIYENGQIDNAIYSLNTITIDYNQNIKKYLLGMEGENLYFYITHNLGTGEYNFEEL